MLNTFVIQRLKMNWNLWEIPTTLGSRSCFRHAQHKIRVLFALKSRLRSRPQPCFSQFTNEHGIVWPRHCTTTFDTHGCRPFHSLQRRIRGIVFAKDPQPECQWKSAAKDHPRVAKISFPSFINSARDGNRPDKTRYSQIIRLVHQNSDRLSDI